MNKIRSEMTPKERAEFDAKELQIWRNCLIADRILYTFAGMLAAFAITGVVCLGIWVAFKFL